MVMKTRGKETADVCAKC